MRKKEKSVLSDSVFSTKASPVLDRSQNQNHSWHLRMRGLGFTLIFFLIFQHYHSSHADNQRRSQLVRKMRGRVFPVLAAEIQNWFLHYLYAF